jgi:hypothetical protein
MPRPVHTPLFQYSIIPPFPSEGRSCETKPRGGSRQSVVGCTNKPNFRVTARTAVVLMGKMPMLRNALRRHYEQGFCAKQTQFRPQQGEGQVPCGKGVMTSRTCKERWKDKANRRGVSRLKAVGAGPPCLPIRRAATGGRPYTPHTSHSAEGRSCETKPIAGARGGRPVSCVRWGAPAAEGPGGRWDCGCVAQPVG